MRSWKNLDTEVAVGEWIETVEYDYPGFHLSMDCFWCEIVKGDLVLRMHEAARWLTREELTDSGVAAGGCGGCGEDRRRDGLENIERNKWTLKKKKNSNLKYKFEFFFSS